MRRWFWAALLAALALVAGPAALRGQTVGRPPVDTGPMLPPAAGPVFVPATAPIVPPPILPAPVAPGTKVSAPFVLPPGQAGPVSVNVSSFAGRLSPPIGPGALPVTMPAADSAPIVMPLATVALPVAPVMDPLLSGTIVGSTPTLPAPAPAVEAGESKRSGSGPAESPSASKGETAPKSGTTDKGLTDSLHQDDCYGFKSLFDSLHPQGGKGKAWYEKLSVRGYTQFRFGRSLHQEADSAEPSLLGDRAINGSAENFSIRRARFILFGDVSEHLGLYAQPDFSNTPPGSSTATFFAQLRDLYGDVYIDKEKVHRLRVGLSKVPYGWENLQSSQNRIPLDRTDPMNTGVSPNERDLGVFYYWTPEDKQKLFKDLVDGGLKGSGNYGIFGVGVYNGQGGSQLEQNFNLHAVARATWPIQLEDGQVVECSLQGYTGQYVVEGVRIRPLGIGPTLTPERTRSADDRTGHRDQRIAASFVWYPQPFGIQAEWSVGEGPGLNDAQTAVENRSLHGGYLMAMYKIDTPCHGIVTPYARYQNYQGGYRSVANAPYGTHEQCDIGVEWQIRREMELAIEYSVVNGINLNASTEDDVIPYRKFDGSVLRVQFQINY